jgi:hypothetical protein
MKKNDPNTTQGQTPKENLDSTKMKIPSDDRQAVSAAHEQAEKDMEEDAELTASNPNDDLDEGETARLGEDQTDLI